MAIATTYEERMALISELAPKYNKLAAAARNASAGKAMSRKINNAQAKKEKNNFMYDNDNHNHYTDASKYAEQYYGETYRATTGLDNDWGDY